MSRAAHSPGSAAAPPPGGAWSSEEAFGGRSPSPGGSAGKARPVSAGPTRNGGGLRAAPVNHGVTAGKPKIAAAGAPAKVRWCRLTPSNPSLNRMELSASHLNMITAFNFASILLSNSTCAGKARTATRGSSARAGRADCPTTAPR